MASKMEYEESPYKADSPLSYDVEEGELSSGPRSSSPGTIRDNASECSTQTNEYVETVTSMRVVVDNSTDEQHTNKIKSTKTAGGRNSPHNNRENSQTKYYSRVKKPIVCPY